MKNQNSSTQSWNKVVLPERKLPRGFLVYANYTLTGLESRASYEVKVAAINSQGEIGGWSKPELFLFNSKGPGSLLPASSPLPLVSPTSQYNHLAFDKNP